MKRKTGHLCFKFGEMGQLFKRFYSFASYSISPVLRSNITVEPFRNEFQRFTRAPVHRNKTLTHKVYLKMTAEDKQRSLGVESRRPKAICLMSCPISAGSIFTLFRSNEIWLSNFQYKKEQNTRLVEAYENVVKNNNCYEIKEK